MTISSSSNNRITAMKILLIIFLSFTQVFAKEIILSSEDFPPFTSKKLYQDGFVSQIVESAFAIRGYKVKYVFYPGARSFKEAESGTLVGTVPWAYRKDREKKFYYSDSVCDADVEMFFYKRGLQFDWDTDTQNYEELRGVPIGAVRSYDYGEKFQNAEKEKVISVERVIDIKQNFRRLIRNRLKVVISQRQVGMFHLQSSFSSEEIKSIEFRPIKNDGLNFYHILFSKAHPEGKKMRDEFNIGLKQIKKSGVYFKILKDLNNGKYSREK